VNWIGYISRARVFFSYLAVYAKMAVLVLLRRPYKLTFLVTDGCNLHCQVCSVWKRQRTHVRLAEVTQIWSAFKIKPCWINISGGEPTLNPELADILSFFVSMRRSLLITLTTNGQIEFGNSCRRLLAINRRCILFVSVSVDGEQVVHDCLRGQRGAYAQAMCTIEQLRTLAKQYPALGIGMSTTLSNGNIHGIIPFLTKAMRRLPVTWRRSHPTMGTSIKIVSSIYPERRSSACCAPSNICSPNSVSMHCSRSTWLSQ